MDSWKSRGNDVSNHVRNVERTLNDQEAAFYKVSAVKKRSPQRILMLKTVTFYKKIKFQLSNVSCIISITLIKINHNAFGGMPLLPTRLGPSILTGIQSKSNSVTASTAYVDWIYLIVRSTISVDSTDYVRTRWSKIRLMRPMQRKLWRLPWFFTGESFSVAFQPRLSF